jgi:alpha-L-rhamnosidase
MSYKEFATKRLAEYIAEPGKSDDGIGRRAGAGLFSGGQASNKPYTLTTGFDGTPNLLPALTKNGEAAATYKLFSNDQDAATMGPCGFL